jgi:CheY-like chemotaxis protein
MRKRVLIIEDSRFLRAAFEKVISRSGCEVLAAADGEEGLQMAQDSLPDVIVLDWIMPRMQGAEVLTKLKQDPKTRSIPVIVVSGIESKERVAISSLAENASSEQNNDTANASMFLDKNTLNLTDLASHVTRLCEATNTLVQ